ncbi:hypothetical protein MNBD_GAMMA18-776 [hydrothermal vent metagenome]|uniref:DUF11 domain-containing protein n=1 Tax=hydrothermal vent metagenome TaxID=652676 RepID=A0A3B0ZE58_9ZZZZ
MKQKKLILSLLLAALSFAFSCAQANEKGVIELKMIVAEEIEILDERGKKIVRLVKPVNVVPGDKVVYTTEYYNKGERKADKVVITNPIPKDLIYLEGSAEQNGALVTFSINDSKSFSTADKLMIEDKDGKSRSAIAKDYTHIRWTIDSIAAGGKGTVRFSARLK